jgi:hypothetical protein
MQRIAIAVAVGLLPVSLWGQWLNLPTPGIPRTNDGKPNLTAPAPRTAYGEPGPVRAVAPAIQSLQS